MESRLSRWIACSSFDLLHDPFIEAKKPWPVNSTFAYWWQTIEDRVLLCVEEVARTSSHLSFRFGGFMVHRDVPLVTYSQQFLDDPATHGIHHPFRLDGALLLHTAPCPYRPTDAPVFTSRGAGRPGEAVVLGPCATASGFTTSSWLVAACAERVVRGAVDDPTVRDWLAAVNDGIPANAVVMRPAIGFDAGRPLILIVMQVPGVMCPCHGSCFKLYWFIRETWYPTGKAAHGGRGRSVRRRKRHLVSGWTRLEPPGEYPSDSEHSSAVW